MNERIFEKISQVSVIANKIRFKILLALFNSDNFRIGSEKLGVNSHNSNELTKIVSIPANDLDYHLKILIKSNLVEKLKDNRGYYHITENGGKILKEFGITQKLVCEVGNKIVNS